MKIAVVYSVASQRQMAAGYGETDADSQVIASKVVLGLESLGHKTEIIAISEHDIAKVLDIKADVIFNLVEWSGHDTYLSEKVFDLYKQLNIAITGSSKELFVLTGDKILLKRELQKYDFPTPKGVVLETGNEVIDAQLKYPVIIKPSIEHCSTGLTAKSVVHNEKELRMVAKQTITQFKQRVIAEEFIVGRELLVYLLEDAGVVKVLPIEEVIFQDKNPLSFQTYEAKWEVQHPDYQNSEVVVAKLTEWEKRKIEQVSRDIFKTFGFCGYARFDVRLKDGVPYMLECNANPSVYDGDGTLTDPNEEVIPGIKFGDYLKKIVEAAVNQREKSQIG